MSGQLAEQLAEFVRALGVREPEDGVMLCACADHDPRPGFRTYKGQKCKNCGNFDCPNRSGYLSEFGYCKECFPRFVAKCLACRAAWRRSSCRLVARLGLICVACLSNAGLRPFDHDGVIPIPDDVTEIHFRGVRTMQLRAT